MNTMHSVPEQLDYYFTIEKPSIAEFRDRGSKFIAYAFHIDTLADFKERLAEVKKEHPKASHHCFAYRMGIEGNIFRVSDDGEPSGSAGRPILGQLDSRQVTDALVIVVRYFGGTLLGVPGLINAYKSVTALALQVTPITQRPVMIRFSLEFDYLQMNDVMKIIKTFGCEIVTNESQLFCTVVTDIPKNRLDEALTQLKDLRSVQITKVPK